MPAPSANHPAPLHVSLFGRARVVYGTQSYESRLPRKSLALLAYLVIFRNERIARDALAYSLWPEIGDGEARANLRRHLYALNRTLPDVGRPWIVSDAKTIAWNPEAPLVVDIAEYERCGNAAVDRAEALDLYRGDLLQNVDEEWLSELRDQWRERHCTNLAAIARERGRSGDFPAAIGALRKLLTLDPWREDAIRELIELRAQSGDRAGALREFDAFATRLRADLGVEPMPETLECRNAVARGGAPRCAHCGALPTVDRAPGLQR